MNFLFCHYTDKVWILGRREEKFCFSLHERIKKLQFYAIKWEKLLFSELKLSSNFKIEDKLNS